MRPATAAERHPALDILMHGRWDDALGRLHAASADVVSRWRLDDLMASVRDRGATAVTIEEIVEELYAVGKPNAGALALAWSRLTCDPRQPTSFWAVLPQLQFALDQADCDAEFDAEVDADLRARIKIWWRAAEGGFTTAKVSIFRLADPEAECWPDPAADLAGADMVPAFGRTSNPQTLFADLGLPTLVVMPKAKSSKLNNFHAAYKDLVDAALPLIVVRDLQRLRMAMHAEFPHAVAAVDLLVRDLREDKPFRIKPAVLVGSPGAGKSRLIRRLADLAGLSVYRYDAASSSDSQFGGTGKAWSNTEPSVPARAVAQSKTANPIVMVDEIEKAAERNFNGRLWDAMLPFLDPETAGRYRDQSLDSELELSAICYISTANDITKLPSPLRDRLRVIKVPTPTLQHLPALAASVMRDLAAQDEARAGDAPLAGDELAVIGKAWAKAGFSMRALQKIVGATLDARDQHAMRH
jgi:ATP-dependent Lon protease